MSETKSENMIILDLTRDELAILRYLAGQFEHWGEPLKDVRSDLGAAAPADPYKVLESLVRKVLTLRWHADTATKPDEMSEHMRRLEAAAGEARHALDRYAPSTAALSNLCQVLEAFAVWAQRDEREVRHENVRALAVEIGPHLDPIVAGQPTRTPMGDLPTWGALEERAAAERLRLLHTADGEMVTLKCAGGGMALCLTVVNLTEEDRDQVARSAIYAVLRELEALP